MTDDVLEAGRDAAEQAGRVPIQVMKPDISRERGVVEIAPDSVCIEPLIPGGDHPSQEMDFSVTIHKGAVYNPKGGAERTGCYGKRIHIEYGAWVNGAVFGHESVELESGGTRRRGGGLIYGPVASQGEVLIHVPLAHASDYADDKPLLIVGDVYGRKVRIEGPTMIFGNVIAKDDLSITAETTVHGLIVSLAGSVRVQQTSAYSIIAGSQLEVGCGVSVLIPVIWVKGGGKEQAKPPVEITAPVRVIGPYCFKHGRELGFEEEVALRFAFNCPVYLDECPLPFERLDESDSTEYEGGYLISNAWRTLTDQVGNLPEVRSLLDRHLKERKDEKGFMKRFKELALSGYVTLDEMLPTIKAVTQVTQNIQIVRDSVVTGGMAVGAAAAPEKRAPPVALADSSLRAGIITQDVRDSVVTGGLRADVAKEGRVSQVVQDSVVTGGMAVGAAAAREKRAPPPGPSNASDKDP